MTRTSDIQNLRISDKSKVEDKRLKNKLFEQRLRSFFVRVIRLCKKCPINPITGRIISQLTACSGSVPANYAEASEAMSKKDFAKSIKISRKESKEAIIWLEGLNEATEYSDPEFSRLSQEAQEFIYIFSSIIKKVT